MFKDRTVFVVGAGASAEIGFPVGSQLAEIIAGLFHFKIGFGRMEECDWPIWNAWRSKFEKDNDELNAHINAGRQIANGIFLSRSIDNYLYQHGHDERITFCGKSAIVRAILKAEQDSKLKVDPLDRHSGADVRNVDGTWYAEFARILMDRRRKDDLENLFQGISVICFNYDRSIEHFLVYAIASLYAIEPEQAKYVVDTLKIFRPYGSVGPLRLPSNGVGICYGEEVDTNVFLNLCDGIKTYNEQIEDETILHNIKNEISKANQIVFLGFGFHTQNMEILTPKKPGNVRQVLCTVKGLSAPNIDSVKQRIEPLVGPSVNINHAGSAAGCAEFFQEFQMALQPSD